jgi:hypothetical protein
MAVDRRVLLADELEATLIDPRVVGEIPGIVVGEIPGIR